MQKEFSAFLSTFIKWLMTMTTTLSLFLWHLIVWPNLKLWLVTISNSQISPQLCEECLSGCIVIESCRIKTCQDNSLVLKQDVSMEIQTDESSNLWKHYRAAWCYWNRKETAALEYQQENCCVSIRPKKNKRAMMALDRSPQKTWTKCSMWPSK